MTYLMYFFALGSSFVYCHFGFMKPNLFKTGLEPSYTYIKDILLCLLLISLASITIINNLRISNKIWWLNCRILWEIWNAIDFRRFGSFSSGTTGFKQPRLHIYTSMPATEENLRQLVTNETRFVAGGHTRIEITLSIFFFLSVRYLRQTQNMNSHSSCHICPSHVSGAWGNTWG